MTEVGYLHTSFWEENMISSVQVRVIFCLDCSTNLPKPAQHLLVIQHAHPSTTNGNDSEGSALVIFEKMNQSRRDVPKERADLGLQDPGLKHWLLQAPASQSATLLSILTPSTDSQGKKRCPFFSATNFPLTSVQPRFYPRPTKTGIHSSYCVQR